MHELTHSPGSQCIRSGRTANKIRHGKWMHNILRRFIADRMAHLRVKHFFFSSRISWWNWFSALFVSACYSAHCGHTTLNPSSFVALVVCTLLQICTWNIWKSAHNIAPESCSHSILCVMIRVYFRWLAFSSISITADARSLKMETWLWTRRFFSTFAEVKKNCLLQVSEDVEFMRGSQTELWISNN